MFNGSIEKIALFVDAGNLAYMTNALGIKLNFDLFLDYFNKRNTTVVYAGFYTAVETIDGLPEGRNRPLQPMLDHLSDHGYTLVTKPTKSYRQADGVNKVKGNMDVEIAWDIAEMWPHVDRIVLVTGDGDFKSVVEGVIKKGRPVHVVAARSANMLSADLRKAASKVIDLADIYKKISDQPA